MGALIAIWRKYSAEVAFFYYIFPIVGSLDKRATQTFSTNTTSNWMMTQGDSTHPTQQHSKSRRMLLSFCAHCHQEICTVHPSSRSPSTHDLDAPLGDCGEDGLLIVTFFRIGSRHTFPKSLLEKATAARGRN